MAATTSVDERSKSRQSAPLPGVQVMNLSFPRCATMSIQAALDQLGYQCWHSTLLFGDVKKCEGWMRAQDAKYLGKGEPLTRAEWDDLFSPYTAVSADPPAFGFAEDFVRLYPEAKIILVERDIDSWFDSFDNTTMDHLFRRDLNAVASIDPDLIGPIRDVQQHWVRNWWRVGSKAEMQAMCRDMFRRHYETIRKAVPKERLLDYKLGSGWEPLCEFLGKDVPDTPFPVRNDRSHVKARNRFIINRGLMLLARASARVLSPVLVAGLAWWAWQRYWGPE